MHTSPIPDVWRFSHRAEPSRVFRGRSVPARVGAERGHPCVSARKNRVRNRRAAATAVAYTCTLLLLQQRCGSIELRACTFVAHSGYRGPGKQEAHGCKKYTTILLDFCELTTLPERLSEEWVFGIVLSGVAGLSQNWRLELID